MKARLVAAVLAAGALAALASPAAAQITIHQLAGVDANGRCTIRPTGGATWYTRITAGGLTHAQVLHHAAARLGYGPSPVGPLLVSTANDCSTVFVADELARQVAALGTTTDQPQLTTARRGALPFTMFPSADINAALTRLKQNPVPSDATGTTAWEARTSLTTLKTLREVVGSQRMSSNVLVDVQLNLPEVMLELWSNHFNVELEKANYYSHGSDGYLETMRGAQGGTFASLLTTVMRQPAMLVYLDNQNNRCDPGTGRASNQNLGRELLELHTLGVGPSAGVYGQADVEAVSSILCGWNVLPYSTPRAVGASGFVFNSQLAHPSALTVMGTSFPATGEARVTSMLAMLAGHSATRAAICAKLSARFYAPSLRAAAAAACVTAWGTTGNLKTVVQGLLQRNEFWTAANYRTLLRSPIELVVAVARRIGVKLTDLSSATTAAGLTEAPFVPSGLTTAQVLQDLAALRASNPYKGFLQLKERIDRMLGFPRMKVPPPTGYPMDGAAFLSSNYIDDASRLGLEVAAPLNFLNARTDLSADSERLSLNDQFWATSASASLEWFLEQRMKLGNVVNPSGAVSVPLTAAHLANLLAVFSNTSLWAVHANFPTVGRSNDTLLGLRLGSAAELWR